MEGESVAIPPHADPGRLGMWMDALYAVLATVLFLPLMESLSESETEFFEGGDALSTGEYETKFDGIEEWTSALSGFVLVCFFHQNRVAMDYYVKYHMAYLQTIECLSAFFLGLLPFIMQLTGLGKDYSTLLEAGLALVLCVLSLLQWEAITNPKNRLYIWKPFSEAERKGALIFSAALCGYIAVICLVSAFLPWIGGILFLLLPVFKAVARRRIYKTPPDDDEATFARVPLRRMNRERFICYTDAIIAFSVTLIAADLRLAGSYENVEQEENSIRGSAPEIVAYMCAFFLMGVFWYLHDRVISVVEEVSAGLYWLSTIGVAMFPTLAFGTKYSILALWYGYLGETEAVLFVAIPVVIVGLSFGSFYIFIYKYPSVVKESFVPIVSKRSFFIKGAGTIGFIVGPGLAGILFAFFSPVTSFISSTLPIIILPVYWIVCGFSSDISAQQLADIDHTHSDDMVPLILNQDL